MKNKYCSTCGKEFSPDHPARKHHTPRCKQLARNAEMRRWRKKQGDAKSSTEKLPPAA